MQTEKPQSPIGYRPKGDDQCFVIQRICDNRLYNLDENISFLHETYLRKLNILEALCKPIYSPEVEKKEWTLMITQNNYYISNGDLELTPYLIYKDPRINSIKEELQSICDQLNRPVVEKQGLWISTGDKMPDRDTPESYMPHESKQVLVFSDGSIFCARYDHDSKYWTDGQTENFDVTHWMPLPSKPDGAATVQMSEITDKKPD